MKAKILLLPTYYPTKNAPIVGSQIKEQAELVADIYDIRVIYCASGMGLRRFIFQSIFGKFLKGKGYSDFNGLSESKIIPAFGVYYFNSKLFSERLNFKLRKNAYKFVLRSILNSGWSPNLISSRGFEIGGGMALEISRTLKIPYVHTENTAFLFDSTFSLFKLNLYKRVLSSASALMFVSSFLLKNTLMHGFIQPEKSIIIGNPVDSTKFYTKVDKASTAKRILITGYNSYIKDFVTFFKALEVVRSNNNVDIIAIIAITYGNEKTIEELKNIAKRYNVLEICEFRLKVSREKMPDLIRSCDMYVSTSIIETFGIAMLESLFCGIPVVSTKNGGVEDFINCKNGLLCEIGDYNCIAKSIEIISTKLMIYSPEVVSNSVQKKFNSKKYRNRIQHIYQEVIAESSFT